MSIATGSKVMMNYALYLEDGTLHDTNDKDTPFEFVVGNDDIIPALEAGIISMSLNEQKDIVIQPDDAYGEHRSDLVGSFQRDQIDDDDLELEIGDILQINTEENPDETIDARITQITDDNVVFDGNHELAGKTLRFNVTVLDIITN